MFYNIKKILKILGIYKNLFISLWCERKGKSSRNLTIFIILLIFKNVLIMKNSIINQFFGVDGLEKVNVTSAGNVYKKETFDKFMVQQFPQNVENGIIIPSKYETTAKKARKVLRTMLLEVCEMFLNQKTNEQKKKFAIQFAKFYSEFYIVNDYTLESVTNGKLKPESQEIIAKCLPEIKTLLEEQKTTKKNK